MKCIQSKILLVANSYKGTTEKPGNSGWNNTIFEREMIEIGWKKGYSWCALFAELVYKKAFESNPDHLRLINDLFSAGSLKTYQNFRKYENECKEKGLEPLFETVQSEPIAGAVGVFRFGSSWQGHTVIVENNEGNSTIRTIEGNSSENGSREGTVVAANRRNYKKITSSFSLVGFIQPNLNLIS